MSVTCRYGCLLPDDQWEAFGYHWRKLTEEDCVNRAKRIWKQMHPAASIDWLRANFKLPPEWNSYLGKDVAVEECPVSKRQRATRAALKNHNADLFEPL